MVSKIDEFNINYVNTLDIVIDEIIKIIILTDFRPFRYKLGLSPSVIK